MMKYAFVLFILVFISFVISIISWEGIVQNGDFQNDLHFGGQLTNSLIVEIAGIHFIQCLNECTLYTRCRSVNYFRKFPLCQLNSNKKATDEGNFMDNPSSVYSERTSWGNHQDITVACTAKNCGMNEKCEQSIHGGFECKISDCGDPPSVDHAEMDRSRGIGVHSKVTYRCVLCMESSGKTSILCQPNGYWTTQPSCYISEWTRFQETQYRCFRAQNSPDWYEAKFYCEQEGAYLAEVNSEGENVFLECLVGFCSKLNKAWLGGISYISTTNWVWVNSLAPVPLSSASGFSKWHTNQPNLDRSENNCLAMKRKQNTWGWIYRRCSRDDNLDSFLCEKDIL